MYTRAALRDVHDRTHACLRSLLAHCRSLTQDELHQSLPDFGYATVRLQIHHVLGAERYWMSVIDGRLDTSDDAAEYATVEALESLQRAVQEETRSYLRGTTDETVNTIHRLRTWRGEEIAVTPAHVILRTQAHVFHHQGQVLAMCRHFGKPGGGLDFPLDPELPADEPHPPTGA